MKRHKLIIREIQIKQQWNIGGFFCHKFGKQGGKNVGGWGRRRS